MIRMRSGGLDLTVMKCEGEDWMAKKKKKKKKVVFFFLQCNYSLICGSPTQEYGT